MTERPVDPTELFERACTQALSERDVIARRRAAAWLGDSEELGPAALGALVKAAARDRDEGVRESALAALERLGHVALLLKDDVSALNELTVRGETGALGEIERREDQWWMKLNRLPDTFEQAKPVVAIPGALEGELQIDWSGEIPGVVVADEPVAEGALELFLGKVAEPASPRAEAELFSHVYLLNPRKPRRGV